MAGAGESLVPQGRAPDWTRTHPDLVNLGPDGQLLLAHFFIEAAKLGWRHFHVPIRIFYARTIHSREAAVLRIEWPGCRHYNLLELCHDHLYYSNYTIAVGGDETYSFGSLCSELRYANVCCGA
jgi:hypothetical protein